MNKIYVRHVVFKYEFVLSTTWERFGRLVVTPQRGTREELPSCWVAVGCLATNISMRIKGINVQELPALTACPLHSQQTIHRFHIVARVKVCPWRPFDFGEFYLMLWHSVVSLGCSFLLQCHCILDMGHPSSIEPLKVPCIPAIAELGSACLGRILRRPNQPTLVGLSVRYTPRYRRPGSIHLSI